MLGQPLAGSNTKVVPPAAASSGFHGRPLSVALKRHLVRSSSSPSCQSVSVRSMSVLPQAHGY